MMQKVFIGSSNVYRFVEYLDDEDQKSITMKNCTRIKPFKVLMDALVVDDRYVIISVVENFVCEAVGDAVVKEDIERLVTDVLNEFVEVIRITTERLPRSKFSIVEPMSRPGVKWYSDAEEVFRKIYTEKIVGLGRININMVRMEELPTQLFDNFGVHLTQMAGKMFVEAILYSSNHFFKAQLVDLGNVQEAMEVNQGSSDTGDRIPVVTNTAREKTIEDQLAEMRDKLEDRQANDDRVFARIREELDFTANQKKEDRIVISGMMSIVARPVGQVEFRGWIKGIVSETLNEIVPNSGAGIQFVAPSRSFGNVIPMCEVKMQDRELAMKVRKEFGRLRKEGKLTGRLFISNSVTLATRVRLEILRAIAKKCSSGVEDMFCMGFTSRPVLQIKRKDGGGQQALTFVDAIARYGGRVRESELALAYERAGVTFRGQMAQNFVVLTEKGVKVDGRGGRGEAAAGRPTLTGGNTVNGGTKRALESERNLESTSSKKQMGVKVVEKKTG